MPPTSRRVLVFAKAPVPGAAKTRLIPLLGAEGAAALHARLVKHTLATARQAALGTIELHGAPADDDFLRHCAARYPAELIDQSEGDLGERMCTALRSALAAVDHAILIGTDSPALTARHLRHAAQALAQGHDAVIVPAEDGGYVLIGLARVDPALFDGIEWSTAHVMEQTRERLRALGWRWVELETLWDVDLPEDYARLVEARLLELRIPLETGS